MHIKSEKRLLYSILFFVINFLIFYSIDIFIRIVAIKICNYGSSSMLGPNIFTFLYISIFTTLIYILPKIYSYILLILVYINTIIVFFAHYFLLKIKGEAFAIYNLQNTSEGAKYINFLYGKINPGLIIFTILILLLCVVSIALLIKINKNNKYKMPLFVYGPIFIICIISLFFVSNTLKYSKDEWENIDLPRYYYLNMNNPKKSIIVMGLYEYSLKDFINYIKISRTTYGSVKKIHELQKKYQRNYEKK